MCKPDKCCLISISKLILRSSEVYLTQNKDTKAALRHLTLVHTKLILGYPVALNQVFEMKCQLSECTKNSFHLPVLAKKYLFRIDCYDQ